MGHRMLAAVGAVASPAAGRVDATVQRGGETSHGSSGGSGAPTARPPTAAVAAATAIAAAAAATAGAAATATTTTTTTAQQQPTTTTPPPYNPCATTEKRSPKNFTAGVVAGLVNTALFNPYDKALYRMCHDHTSFFTRSNWVQPYAGVSQAVWHRIVSYGLFFPLMDFWRCAVFRLHPTSSDARATAAAATNRSSTNSSVPSSSNKSGARALTGVVSAAPGNKSAASTWDSVWAGSLTGTSTALIINPLNVVKFHNWNHHTSLGLGHLGTQIARTYGAWVFTRGLGYTVLRDNIFSVGYGWASHRFDTSRHMARDIGAAAGFVVLASPVNYVRNEMLYAKLNASPPTLQQIVRKLRAQVAAEPGTAWDKVWFVAGRKFGVGWGTLRVGLGMALSRKIYESVRTAL